MRIGLGTTTALSTALIACVAPAWAQGADAVRRYDAPAGPLAHSLSVFVEQSRLQILYPAALVEGRTSPGLQGDYTAEAGLAALLRDTGLAFRRTRPNVYVLYDPNARAGLDDDELTVVDDVVVTGSLIRGVGDGPSPVVSIDRDRMDREGRATVAQLLAALPQNFGGTANEAALNNGGDRSGTNSTYANGVNLRGLGSDATLVLINGRRMAGTGSKGDFADVSSIPTAAIRRADVLLDGASALYGPDVAEEIMSNCAVEVAFAPKELKTARDLSERLGAYTYAALSRSRPAMLGAGKRSVTLSDQRRPLMLPQELMQMDADALIVLKAGLPPIRGRKLRFFSHPALKRRPVAPPDVPAFPPPTAPPPRSTPSPTPPPSEPVVSDEWSYEGLVRSLEREGAPLPPPRGADAAKVGTWVNDFIDFAVAPRNRGTGRD